MKTVYETNVDTVRAWARMDGDKVIVNSRTTTQHAGLVRRMATDFGHIVFYEEFD